MTPLNKVGKMTLMHRGKRGVTLRFNMEGDRQLVLCRGPLGSLSGGMDPSLLLSFVRPIKEADTFTAATSSERSRMWYVELRLCVFLCVDVWLCSYL